jgi:hypothetical protein
MKVPETIMDSLHGTDFVVDAFEFAVGFIGFYGYQFRRYKSNIFFCPCSEEGICSQMCPKSVAATIAGRYLGKINQNKPPPSLPKGWKSGTCFLIQRG